MAWYLIKDKANFAVTLGPAWVSVTHFVTRVKNTVAYFLDARTVESEKQPLLANGSETTFVSRQWPRNKGTTSIASQQILNKNRRADSTQRIRE
jgi:hypothetical protein